MILKTKLGLFNFDPRNDHIIKYTDINEKYYLAIVIRSNSGVDTIIEYTSYTNFPYLLESLLDSDFYQQTDDSVINFSKFLSDAKKRRIAASKQTPSLNN